MSRVVNINTSKVLILSQDNIDSFLYSNKEVFDSVIMDHSLEKVKSPGILLDRLHQHLSQEGRLFLFATILDTCGPPTRLNKQFHWPSTNKHLFSRTNLQLLLEKYGFEKILFYALNSRFIDDGKQNLFKCLAKALQKPLTIGVSQFRNYFHGSRLTSKMHSGYSTVFVSATKKTELSRPSLSIIIPVYNEHNTLRELFSRVLNLQIAGIDRIEIIVIESNSTDGSREFIQSITNKKKC